MPGQFNHQEQIEQDSVSLKQFRANFKEIFDGETTFGSSRAARLELLEGVKDLIEEYLKKGSRIVYLHGRLKEAGYSGSRKELSEWLIEQGLWTKREVSEKTDDNEKTGNHESPEMPSPDETSLEAEISISRVPESPANEQKMVWSPPRTSNETEPTETAPLEDQTTPEKRAATRSSGPKIGPSPFVTATTSSGKGE